jgi:hypothetical protein
MDICLILSLLCYYLTLSFELLTTNNISGNLYVELLHFDRPVRYYLEIGVLIIVKYGFCGG